MLETIDAEDERLLGAALTRRILGCAMGVHRQLGPGLLENAYRLFVLKELELAGMAAEGEVAIPATHRGVSVDCGYRADIIVADKVLLELKSVERLLPIHEAQILTYLKLSGLRVGLLINFNAVKLQHGIRRFVL